MCLGTTVTRPAAPSHDLVKYGYEFDARLQLSFYFYRVEGTPCGFWMAEVTARITSCW